MARFERRAYAPNDRRQPPERQEYAALDAQREALTLSERFVGDFSVES